MSKLNKIGSILDLGGMNLLLCKTEDVITGRKTTLDYLYKILENANESDYPRLIKDMYKMYMGVNLRLSNPVDYNEKIQWLKLYDSTMEKTKLADKYLVREWVKEKISEKYLIPLLGVYERFDDVRFDVLPSRFVLKCNHGSGMNAIVTDKSQFDLEKWRLTFQKWLAKNYAYVGLELHYKDIPPKIVCEELIEEDIVDYRVYCFGGEPGFIKVTRHNSATKGGYDSGFFYPDWKKCEFQMIQNYGELIIPKPQILDELLDVAKILAKDFSFVRTDFYIVNNKLLFSEMTFTPNSGYEQFSDPNAAIYYGSLINTGVGENKNGTVEH